MAMSANPDVQVVGAPTFGCLSDMWYGWLPNGWTFALSPQHYFDAEDVCYEGPGIPPDQSVREAVNVSKLLMEGKDEALERLLAHWSSSGSLGSAAGVSGTLEPRTWALWIVVAALMLVVLVLGPRGASALRAACFRIAALVSLCLCALGEAQPARLEVVVYAPIATLLAHLSLCTLIVDHGEHPHHGHKIFRLTLLLTDWFFVLVLAFVAWQSDILGFEGLAALEALACTLAMGLHSVLPALLRMYSRLRGWEINHTRLAFGLKGLTCFLLGVWVEATPVEVTENNDDPGQASN